MAGAAAEPVGDLATALAHAGHLLAARSPAMAAEQAQEILNAVPGHPVALLILAAAHRARGRCAEARDIVEPLIQERPTWAEAHYERGQALAGLGDDDAAIAALRRAVELKPGLVDAWRALGDRLTLQGDSEGADAAYAQSIKAAVNDPRLVQAAAALCEGQLPTAEHLLRAHLKEHPTDVAAIRMFAEVASRLGRFGDAENLLQRCLELAPSFDAARHNLAVVLVRANKPAKALPEIDQLMEREPHNPNYAALKGATLSRLGDYDQAIKLYAKVLDDHPRQPKVWMSYGHALKTAGRSQDSIDAYRRSLAEAPHFGEAWWSLANLKTFKFTDADIAAMGAALETADINNADRFHLHFALGKALEDRGAFAESFSHYAKGAELRRSELGYDADVLSEQVRRSKTLFTPEFFTARAGQGSPSRSPIFVVGLPRSGSTLIEQILASHSAVEGTMELPDIGMMARRIGGKKKSSATDYPDVLATLSAEQLHELGEEYLARAGVQRKSSRPFFVDKMPNNFLHVGFIKLILPHAKIIDARRHPMATCFSCFKQHFARGQNFSYDLTDLGRYYRDYADLMAHFDRVLPGRIHRVFYERMVSDTEAQVRALLDFCDLPFEPGCLRFYETERAIRTASSEQVRQPVYADAIDHWRNYEPWLEPLKNALGTALADYPAAPALVGHQSR